ncbi:Uncharacterised protein [Vibrio cholerae]|nr:Uncharacterised protein [Vibrio cholerae]CRZ66869.1 Uncharacterised protein [Vibrio cholerae]CRZ74107.1 Uncharacterised protein [Vibrio cholerae]CSA39587.1 Uncharacterised protein [Vibrio cholerae]CSA71402.1 Uncharacterised protein [Vibrio cholerae]
MSSRVIRPPTPEPLTWFASKLCSASRRRTAGLSASLLSSVSDALWRLSGDGSVASGVSWVGSPATAPGFKRASSCLESTVAPSCSKIASRTPASGAGTSSTTLSVSISTITSSRATMSPGFLCHVATVASATDSGKSGTRISMVIMVSSLYFSFLR